MNIYGLRFGRVEGKTYNMTTILRSELLETVAWIRLSIYSLLKGSRTQFRIVTSC